MGTLLCYNTIEEIKMNTTVTLTEKEFIDFFNTRTINENIFNDDGSLNKRYNSSKKTGIIASIFEDHWDNVYLANKDMFNQYRPNADKEVHKIIDCYNANLGCSVYECPDCHDITFISHTCKSRFCSSCGYKYKNARVENIMQTAYRGPHRQIVFTIPRELRKYFFFPFKERINILFQAVNETIYSMLNISFKKDKKGNLRKYISKIKWTAGFFAFLHTFGRSLIFNPHIHVLIAETKLGSNNSCVPLKYFDYNALSKRFQLILLDKLSDALGNSFDKEKSSSFTNHPNGFYVYAEPKKFTNIQSGIEYVARYCGRPAISENRIVDYDGKNITYSYTDHKDNLYHEVTLSAEEFIKLLLRHLIPHQFKTIRYYGFYRKKHIFHKNMILLIQKEKRNFRKLILKHEFSILLSFKRNPYNCPKCNKRMEFMCFLN